MLPSLAIGMSVEYAGARWHVERVLGAEAVLLRSDTGDVVSAHPLKIGLSGARTPLPGDDLHYSDAEWAEASRRRDLLGTLAARRRTTTDVTAAAEALNLTPRRVWALLRQMRMRGDDVVQFLPARRDVPQKAAECRGGGDHCPCHRPALRQALTPQPAEPDNRGYKALHSRRPCLAVQQKH